MYSQGTHPYARQDNIGFALDGKLQLFDFGLARIVENASISNDVYEMSGETGSLRYMAPEVADCRPYNQKVRRRCRFFFCERVSRPHILSPGGRLLIWYNSLGACRVQEALRRNEPRGILQPRGSRG